MNEINEIKIPKGVDSISVTQHDDKIVIEFIPEEPKFKEGDFVYEDGRIMIVKRYPNIYHANSWPIYSDMLSYNGAYAANFSEPTFRYATAEEKQELIELLRKDNKQWNAEKMVIEDIPVYKDGDFVVNDLNAILIFKEAYGDLVSDHAYLPVYGELVIDKFVSCKGVKRHATTEEKQRMTEALAERGKWWNADKKCIEDIPKRKFKAGDKVKIKDGISSETHRSIAPSFVSTMDKFIGKELTVKGYGSMGWVVFYEDDYGYQFDEDWLEPWSDEPKVGDMVIAWNNDMSLAVIGIKIDANPAQACNHVLNNNNSYKHAIKFDGTKEHLEKIRKG